MFFQQEQKAFILCYDKDKYITYTLTVDPMSDFFFVSCSKLNRKRNRRWILQRVKTPNKESSLQSHFHLKEETIVHGKRSMGPLYI